MKDKHYKLMNQEDKEEWERLYDTSLVSIFTIPFMMIKVIYASVVFLLLFTLVIKDYISNYEEYLGNIFIIITSSIQFSVTLLALFHIAWLIGLIVLRILENKWIKNRGYDIKFREYDLEILKKRND